MRKILSFLALALAFTACQNEPVEVVGNGGLVEVVLNIDAPEMNITRTLDGDSQSGRNSALGAIDFFNDADWAKYDVRYILEVYDANDNGSGEPIYLERLVNCLDKYEPTNFVLRLVPDRDYKFVVFADFVDQGNYTKVEPADKLAIADKYYDTTDLRNITAKTDAEDWNAMNEARDAYFVSQVVGISSTGLNHTLTLTRPFGKLRVIATDLDYITGYATPGYVEVTYMNENIFKAFNAVNGVLSTQQMTGNELSYGYTVDKDAPYNEGYDSISTNQTLFADYILAKEGEQIAVNFKMAVYEDAAKTRLIKETDFNTQIPVQRNHLTTIIGDVLTNEANIEIKINDNFDDEFVLGNGDGNQTIVNTWDAGNLTAEGDYAFEITADGNTFTLTLDGSAVVNNTLKAGTYTFTSDEVTEGTFNAVNVKANDTRAMVDVQVIGGLMIVEKLEDTYGINLDLVLDYGKNDIRHASYSYKGNIIFGETLDAPVATATAEGNTITVAWETVEKASTYYVRLVAEGNEFEATTELSKVYANLAWETEYTFEVYATNDTLTSVTTSVQATTEAEPIVETYNIYLKNEDNWEAVYFYAWGDNFATAAWPGEAMTATTVEGVDYYVYNLPAEATGKTINFLFNNGGNGKQTADILDFVVDKDYIYTNYVEPVEPSEVVLYLQPNTNWNVDGARFAAYFFGNGETWVDMTLVEGETNIYAVTVPAGFVDVIFCRMNPGATANNWNNKWNQTADLKVPTDGTNLYIVKEDTWDNGGGEWSTYTPAGSEPVEPTALATPVVKTAVEGNVITLSWDAVDGASHYTVQVDDDIEEVVEETTYVFEGDYGYEYTFTVKAIAADTDKNLNSEATVVTATIEDNAPAAGYTTVAEFLALSGDDVISSDATAEDIAAAPLYTLKGTITSVTQTTYGNFYLNDGTGEVLIYGLCSPEGAQKYWAESGAKVGDDIVIKTIRTEYNGAPQGKNALFVELLPGTLAFYTVSTNAVDFTSAGGEQVVNVTAYNIDAAVTATSDNSIFAVNVDGYNVTISAAANELEEEVTGNITIKVGDLTETVVKASLAAKPAAGVVEGGSSDFHTISATNTSYVSGKTTAGWNYVNCAIFKGGTSDSSPAFKMIGDASNRALCMNGKTSAVGKITSPTFNTGCGTLTFNYGLPFSDSKIKFRVDIIQNGNTVHTFTIENSSASKYTKYSHEEEVNVAGDFQIVFTNLSPSNSTSNKDRTAIWDVEWTGYNN